VKRTLFSQSSVLQEAVGKSGDLADHLRFLSVYPILSKPPRLTESDRKLKVCLPIDGEIYKNNSKWQFRDEKSHWHPRLSGIGSDLWFNEGDFLNFISGVLSRDYLHRKGLLRDTTAERAWNFNGVSEYVSPPPQYFSHSPGVQVSRLMEIASKESLLSKSHWICADWTDRVTWKNPEGDVAKTNNVSNWASEFFRDLRHRHSQSQITPSQKSD
jgi:hypothetical protein